MLLLLLLRRGDEALLLDELLGVLRDTLGVDELLRDCLETLLELGRLGIGRAVVRLGVVVMVRVLGGVDERVFTRLELPDETRPLDELLFPERRARVEDELAAGVLLESRSSKVVCPG